MLSVRYCLLNNDTMQQIKDNLEKNQIAIYFSVVMIAIGLVFCLDNTSIFDMFINPVLAFMLFVTFLQVPVTEIKPFWSYKRFMVALLITNFVIIPVGVGLLALFLPSAPFIKLGVLLVLLAPCIDYVVTFSHLGRADARLLLMATPLLLLLQMFLLPVYLTFMIGEQVNQLIHLQPFIHAFIWLMVIPFCLATLMQVRAVRNHTGKKMIYGLNMLPVPATALTLFIIILAVLPQLKGNLSVVLSVIPFYLIFAIVAPLVGWFVGCFFHVSVAGSRAIAFSAGTRNALVILPLALAIPNAIPILPAIIVTQTLIELISELVYIYIIAKLK